MNSVAKNGTDVNTPALSQVMTFFDQRPTHRIAPDYVEQARENMLKAWREHDYLVEAYLDEDATIEEVNQALERAGEAEAAYYRIYAQWQNSLGEY